MKLPVLIMGVVAMAGLAVVTSSEQNRGDVTFLRAGAKVVSVAPRETAKPSRTIGRRVADLGRWLSGTEQRKTPLAASATPTVTGAAPVPIHDYDDLTSTARAAFHMTRNLGLETEPDDPGRSENPARPDATQVITASY